MTQSMEFNNYILEISNASSFSNHLHFAQTIDHLLRTDRNQLMTNTSTILNEFLFNGDFDEFQNIDTFQFAKDLKKSLDFTNLKYETVFINHHYFDYVNHSLESLLSQIDMPLFSEFMEYTIIIVLHRDEERPHFHRLFLEHYEFDYCHVPLRFDQDILEL